MEKVRPWCGQPSDRGRLKNRNRNSIAKNGGGYTQTGVAEGLKVPCLFMIAEVSIYTLSKNPGGWYTPYTRVYPPIHH